MESCFICGSEKNIKECQICNQMACKKHTERTDPEQYPYGTLQNKQTIVSKNTFCSECFDSIVKPELDIYERTLESAKHVAVWSKSFKGRVHVLKKALKRITLKDFKDKKELTLALGFLTAEEGFNGIIEFEMSSRKVIQNEYQSTRYDGSGLPVLVDKEWLDKSEFYSW